MTVNLSCHHTDLYCNPALPQKNKKHFPISHRYDERFCHTYDHPSGKGLRRTRRRHRVIRMMSVISALDRLGRCTYEQQHTSTGSMTKAVRPPRSITSFSVAKAAGVSQSTVSLVMSGKAEGRVSKATQTLVEKTARQLGYHPNASAQMLRTGVLKLLGLAVPDVQQPFFGQVLVAAELAARENNHGVLLIDISNDPAWVDR